MFLIQVYLIKYPEIENTLVKANRDYGTELISKRIYNKYLNLKY